MYLFKKVINNIPEKIPTIPKMPSTFPGAGIGIFKNVKNAPTPNPVKNAYIILLDPTVCYFCFSRYWYI